MYKDKEMLNRQDIDALMMGALYGELSPAESTSLEEYLSQHPQDRVVLENLKRTRQTLRESNVLDLQAEPPPALSALLLQEAARRAPARPRERSGGLFAKFVLLMRHPAMAAASLVLLVAVAGTLYLKNREDLDEASAIVAADSPAIAKIDPANTPAAAPLETPPRVPADSKYGYRADLEQAAYSGESTKNEREQVAGAKEPVPLNQADGKDQAEKAAKKKANDFVEVTTRPPVPKSVDMGRSEVEGDSSKNGVRLDSTASAVPAAPPARQAQADERQQPPTKPAPVQLQQRARDQTFSNTLEPVAASASDTGVQAQGPEGTAPADDGYADAPPVAGSTRRGVAPEAIAQPVSAQKGDDANAVPKSQHQALVSLVKTNRCRDAGKLAATIFARYPDYYAEFVADDRNVMACRPSIETERRKVSDKRRSKMLNQANTSETAK